MIYSVSLFSKKKIITIFESTDKILKKISDVYDQCAEHVFLIIFSGILEKRSKLRFRKIALEFNPCIQDRQKLYESTSEAFYDWNRASGVLIYTIHLHVCLS